MVEDITFVWDRLVGQYLMNGVIDYIPSLDRFTVSGNHGGYGC